MWDRRRDRSSRRRSLALDRPTARSSKLEVLLIVVVLLLSAASVVFFGVAQVALTIEWWLR